MRGTVLRDTFVRPLIRWRRMKQAHAIERQDNTRFHCPVCDYRGVFIDAPGPAGGRKYGCCPQCGSYERHRLQAKALETILSNFAPEKK